MTSQEVGAVQQLFKPVLQKQIFVSMTDAVPATRAFREAWNTMSIAVRDQVAVGVATQVVEEVNKVAQDKINHEVNEVIRMREVVKECSIL